MATLRIARASPRPHDRAELARLADQVRVCKAAQVAAEAATREAQAELVTAMSARGYKTMTTDLDDGIRYKVTVVQAERLDVNEAGLRKALGAGVYDKLCDLKLNRQKLEVAVAEGRVDPVVVATHASKRLLTPYVKLSESNSPFITRERELDDRGGEDG